jgi:hypothetical protein
MDRRKSKTHADWLLMRYRKDFQNGGNLLFVSCLGRISVGLDHWQRFCVRLLVS